MIAQIHFDKNYLKDEFANEKSLNDSILTIHYTIDTDNDLHIDKILIDRRNVLNYIDLESIELYKTLEQFYIKKINS